MNDGHRNITQQRPWLSSIHTNVIDNKSKQPHKSKSMSQTPVGNFLKPLMLSINKEGTTERQYNSQYSKYYTP